ncbi:MAG: hypothetical protein OMM_13851, partial [Candidatus Magnetoglobus multicellularis str. Araruama]
AFADYDNDGDLDILITGDSDNGKIAKMFRNTGNAFTEDTGINLTGVSHSSTAFGDYDNDGDLDLLITGRSDSLIIAKMYQNTGGNFSEDTTINLMGVEYGSTSFGDYDNDGDLDILISGDTGSNKITKVYRNTGGSFSEDTGIHLIGVFDGASAFGDYDNDGDLDILITGDTGNSKNTTVYQNTDGHFSEASDINLTDVTHSTTVFGDYDNDGDLDILMSGQAASGRMAKIYQNNTLISNTPANAPSSLTSVVSEQIVLLSWSAASDSETLSAAGLSYNLRIGSSPGACDILSPMALPLSNGYRQIPARGAIQTLTATINPLNGGTYYWSVQSIDTAFAGSDFSNESTFTIDQTPIISAIAHQHTVIDYPISIPFQL